MFFDRSFFKGHAPYLTGKQVGFIISGPLGQLTNLRQILEAYTQVEGANMVDIVTDENESSANLDQLLQNLAARLVEYAAEGYLKPSNFLGVGGHLILRDAVWGRLRPTFRADHRFYRRNKMYGFPQNDLKTRLWVDAVSTFQVLPDFRKEFNRRMITEMVKPLQKVVDNL